MDSEARRVAEGLTEAQRRVTALEAQVDQLTYELRRKETGDV